MQCSALFKDVARRDHDASRWVLPDLPGISAFPKRPEDWFCSRSNVDAHSTQIRSQRLCFHHSSMQIFVAAKFLSAPHPCSRAVGLGEKGGAYNYGGKAREGGVN